MKAAAAAEAEAAEVNGLEEGVADGEEVASGEVQDRERLGE